MKLADIAVGNVYRLRNGRTAKVIEIGDPHSVIAYRMVRVLTPDGKLHWLGPQAIQGPVWDEP